MTHRKTGNTNKETQFSRHRQWFFTINNYDTEEKNLLYAQKFEAEIVAFQSECGSTGNAHIQAVIHFKNARSFQSIKKLFPRANFNRCRNLEASIRYCTKEESWTGEFRYYYAKGHTLIDIKNDHQILNHTNDNLPKHPNFGKRRTPSKEWVDWLIERSNNWVWDRLNPPIESAPAVLEIENGPCGAGEPATME